MGVQGLLPQLKDVSNHKHVQEYAGRKAAVDAHGWLHRGSYGCALELCERKPTRRHVEYVLNRVEMLRQHKVEPVLVFDGGKLPAKAREEDTRSARRTENLEKARRHTREGNHRAAMECYQRAVDVTPEMVAEVAKELETINVKYIVAPYEADAQMAYLMRIGMVDLVITEDSDLLAYGCSCVFFKMDKFGHGQEILYEDLPKNRIINLSGFTPQMFQEMCVLSGCDFLQTIPGVGPKTAYRLMNLSKSYKKVLRKLRYDGKPIPDGYAEQFEQALMTFRHQRVFDPINKRLVHLQPVPEDVPESLDLDFLGPTLTDEMAVAIATAKINPITFERFAAPERDGLNRMNPPSEPVFRENYSTQQRDQVIPASNIKNLFTSFHSTCRQGSVLHETKAMVENKQAPVDRSRPVTCRETSSASLTTLSKLQALGKRIKKDIEKENADKGLCLPRKVSRFFDVGNENREVETLMSDDRSSSQISSKEENFSVREPIRNDGRIGCEGLMGASSLTSCTDSKAALEKFACQGKLRASGLRKPRRDPLLKNEKGLKQVSIKSLLGFRFQS